eukprot:6200887-Pleurochrysis_carterae.AAC.3
MSSCPSHRTAAASFVLNATHVDLSALTGARLARRASTTQRAGQSTSPRASSTPPTATCTSTSGYLPRVHVQRSQCLPTPSRGCAPDGIH